MNNPCVTIVTERGPYILQACLTRKGDAVALYTLTIPYNDDTLGLFRADDARVPEAYDPACDYWDADKSGQIVDLWEERYKVNGRR